MKFINNLIYNLMDYVKKLACGLMAVAAITACNHEPATPEDPDVINGNQYMAFNLAMATGSPSGTKADYNPDFEGGSEAECTIDPKKSIFLFYDGTGNFLTSGKFMAVSADGNLSGLDKITLADSEMTGAGMDKKTNAVVVLGPSSVRPSQVVAILNYPGDLDKLKESLQKLNEETVDATITETAGSFLMSNSVYADKKVDGSPTKIVEGAQIARDKVKNTAAEALKFPVDIYVERVVSKVRMTAASGLKTITDATEAAINENGDKVSEIGKYYFELPEDSPSIVDGSFAKVRIVVDGWCVNAYNVSGYTLKEVPTEWLNTAPFANWNVYDNNGNNMYFRSFWAKDINYSGKSDYTFTANDQRDTYNGLVYCSWNDAAKANTTNYTYLYENTVSKEDAKALPGQNANVTSILIAAHVETKLIPSNMGLTGRAAEQSQWTLQDLYSYDGMYFTKNTLQIQIANRISDNYEWAYTEGGVAKTSNVAPEDLTLELTNFDTNCNNRSLVGVEVKSIAKSDAGVTDAKLYKIGDHSKEITAADLTDLLKKSYTNSLTGFNQGKCYYMVPIVHHSNGDLLYGNVRNHIYNLVLKGIAKVGNPIFHPDEKLVVIPGEKEDYYVAAELRLLKWTVVSQDVDIK